MDYMNLGVTSRKTGLKFKAHLPRDEYSMENIADFFSDDTSLMLNQQNKKSLTPVETNQGFNGFISDGNRNRPGKRASGRSRSSLLSLPPMESFNETNRTTQYAIPSTSVLPPQQILNEPYENQQDYYNDASTQSYSIQQNVEDINDDYNESYQIQPPTPPQVQKRKNVEFQRTIVNKRPLQAEYKIDDDLIEPQRHASLAGDLKRKQQYAQDDVYASNISGFINDNTRDEINNTIVEIEDDADDEDGVEGSEEDDDYNDVSEDGNGEEEDDDDYNEQQSRLMNVTLEPIQEDSDEVNSSASEGDDAFDGTRDVINNMNSTRGTSFDEDENEHASSDDDYIASQAKEGISFEDPHRDHQGLRRSKRVRVPTLDYWRNEKIIYKRASKNPGLEIEEIVRKDPADEIDEEEILRRRRESKKLEKKTNYSYNPNKKRPGRPKKQKEPNEDILQKIETGELESGSWIKFGILESTIKSKTGLPEEEIVAFAPDTAQKEDLEENEEDMYSLSIMFDKYKDHFESGMYKLPPQVGKKKMSSSGNFMINFFVVQGVTEVSLGSTKFICTEGSSFQIPFNNDYAFDNKGDNEAKLYFVRVSIAEVSKSKYESGIDDRLFNSSGSSNLSINHDVTPNNINPNQQQLFVEDSIDSLPNNDRRVVPMENGNNRGPSSFYDMEME